MQPATADIDRLCEQVASYLPDQKVKRVRLAYRYAAKLHNGQMRHSGDPYITHPLAVAQILADMRVDSASVIAAMLHDAIEDTDADKDSIAKHFGKTVANLVDGVSNLEHLGNVSRKEMQSHNLHKIAMASAEDVRVILVKLADRLHNMRTIGSLPLASQRRIGHETLEFYAPIAHRLGLHDMCTELEELSFAAVYPLRYRCIASVVKSKLQNHRQAIQNIGNELKKSLSDSKIKATVTWRKKSLYGIYRKMRDTKRMFADIMDIFGYRIVVKDVPACYLALGVVHNLYRPLDGEFEDFIATPKKNGYQSLHTILYGLHGIRIEIQIRTHAMDEMASKGLASHDFYKTRERGHEIQHKRVRQWVSGLRDMQQGKNPGEFMEALRSDLFARHIYVYTPEGDVMELPKGSTPVDFAYAVHTDVGNHCVGAVINKERVILSSLLENGETVRIITADDARPNPSWVHFVATAKARTQIRRYLREQKREDAIKLGRQLLQRSIAILGYEANKIKLEENKDLLNNSGAGNFEDLLANIGFGQQNATLIAQKLLGKNNQSSIWSGIQKRIGIRSRYQPVRIKDTENMVVDFGHCCSPIPGDNIAGSISAGRGLVVHNRDCVYIAKAKYNDEIINLEWSDQVQDEFTTRLDIQVESARNILAEIANLVNRLDASVENLSFGEKGARDNKVVLSLGVRDRIHLAQIIKALRKLKYVIKVNRSINA